MWRVCILTMNDHFSVNCLPLLTLGFFLYGDTDVASATRAGALIGAYAQ